MEKLISLKHVSASLLPKRVIVLMAKYSQAIHKHSGVAIELSSVDVFKQIHQSRKNCDCLDSQRLHYELLVLVNKHLESGTMHSNSDDPNAIKYEKPENGNIAIH